MKRRATAVWKGTGKDGKVRFSTQSTVLNKTQYLLVPDLKTAMERIRKNWLERPIQTALR